MAAMDPKFAFFPNSRGDVGSDALQMKKSPFLC